MGRICPILNHPLNDGVLIEDELVVNFVQKRNLDFLPNELVCRSCKREVTKLYNKKLKKAVQMHKSLMHDGSISSLKSSKTTSSASTNSERSISLNDSLQREQEHLFKTATKENNKLPNHQLNDSVKVARDETSTVPYSNKMINIPSATITTENFNNQAANKKTVPENSGNKPNITIRKKTIKDYLNINMPIETAAVSFAAQLTAKSRNSPRLSVNRSGPLITGSNSDDSGDDTRRLSQEPTTSRAANVNKRPISAVIDSDDNDEEHLSPNAINGTRLPHIQPVPPKRKSGAFQQNTLSRDIMDEYIKDITGG